VGRERDRRGGEGREGVGRVRDGRGREGTEGQEVFGPAHLQIISGYATAF